MSIELTKDILRIPNSFLRITPTEKHILTVLCFIALDNGNVYREIDRLASDCNLSKKTIERGLKSLRDKNYISYTGFFVGTFNKIPIYNINFVHGLSGGDLKSITDFLSQDNPHSVRPNRQYIDNENQKIVKEENPDCPNSEQSEIIAIEEDRESPQDKIARLEELIDTEERYLKMMEPQLQINPNLMNENVVKSTKEKIIRLKQELNEAQQNPQPPNPCHPVMSVIQAHSRTVTPC